MAIIKRIGFGQVEPNQLAAQRNGQIYAQLPANKNLKTLENGQFVKYDYASGEVNLTGKGEWMLVLNEVKLYDEAWRESYKDFALEAKNAVDGIIVPRVFKTEIGDIYTTNCLGAANTKGQEYAGIEVDVKDILVVDEATGYLKKSEDNGATADMAWEVAKVYTMPDMQPAVKIQRIK